MAPRFLCFCWLVGLGVSLPACGGEGDGGLEPTDPAPVDDDPFVKASESCEGPDLDQLEAFVPCTLGGGSFGDWTVDGLGLPAYDYRLDQYADERARFPNTELDADGNELDRREHWAAFGNRRLDVMAFNDGYIEVTTQDRGVEYLNKFAPEQQNFAGGFSTIDDGGKVWSSAYKWRPRPSKTERRFGMGYAESSILHDNLELRRVSAAPPGSDPLVVSDVTLTNHSVHPKTIKHYESWDVGRRPIEINWLVSGDTFSVAPENARQQRDERNGLFDESVSYDPGLRTLGLRRKYVGSELPPNVLTPSAADYYPNDPFLAVLMGDASDVYSDQRSFFGGGGVAAPSAAVDGLAGEGISGGKLGADANGLGQPRTFVIRSDVTLAPGESKTLRFAFGYARSGEPFQVDPSYADPSYDARAAYAEALKPKLFYFASGRDPVLHRELAWHAYQVETSVAYRDYWQGPVVPQGSAYLYLHGADGAARDLGLFAVPLVYTDPELAKAELRLYTGIQYESGRFSYAFQGHGMLDDAEGLHKAPSDLCLFFLWALGEYLGATGDFAFLDETAPFYPREARPNASVWDHVVAALRQQFDVISVGAHGLIRVGTGDWSDGIVVAAPDRALAISSGESVPNTQMAVAVLPRIADLIEGRDAALAAEIRTHVAEYRTAAAAQWGGEFFYRAYYGDDKPVDADSINLESQIWALIGDVFASPGDRQILIDKIAEKLDDNSPIGATLWPGGQVWPAISVPLTWGYAKTDPERAWKHFARNTLAAHAVAFPDVWFGIWSAPDGMSSKSGHTWASQVTPMKDFPVQNNNAHALPILAALRVAGIDADASGLVITPSLADDFSLKARLVELSRRGSEFSGRYRPSGGAQRRIQFRAPPGGNIQSASLDGSTISVSPGANSVDLQLPAGAAREVSFVVTISAP